jgi:hypothetical protein
LAFRGSIGGEHQVNRRRLIEQLDEMWPDWRDDYDTPEDAAQWAGLDNGEAPAELDFEPYDDDIWYDQEDSE